MAKFKHHHSCLGASAAKGWIIIIILAFSTCNTYGQTAKDTIAPVLTIAGPDTISMEVFSKLLLPKVTAIDNHDGDLSQFIVNNAYLVNTSRIGYNAVVFSVSDSSGNTGYALLRVQVMDTIRPTIKLVGAASQIIPVKTNYPDSGVVAEDNYQKSLYTDTSGTFYAKFKTPRGYADDTGMYTIIYSTTDSSGNSISITRVVYVKDFTAPVITLQGAEDTIVCRYAPYEDKGYVVTDNYETAGTLKIDTLGTFTNTLLPGYYTRYYIAKDHAGNTARTEKRTIYVRPSDECNDNIAANSMTENTIAVYPNPSSGMITVEGKLPIDLNIEVTNTVGEIIQRFMEVQMTDTFELNLSAQPPGVYLLHLHSSHFSTYRKVIIRH